MLDEDGFFILNLRKKKIT